MRRVIVSLLLLGAAIAPATADPHNLEGGALIAHYIPDFSVIRYTTACESYFLHSPLTQCEDQNNRIDTYDYEMAHWFVVALFEEDKIWREVQFGLSNFDPCVMYFIWSYPCFPEYGGGFEIPSANWPNPGEGTTIIADNVPWEGNWQPVYYFHTYAYAYVDPDIVQLIPDPTAARPFGGFRNCSSPPEEWSAALGGIGINMDGTWVCSGMEGFVCCVGEDCIIVYSENECSALDGEAYPEWHACEPANPCTGTPVTISNWGRIKALYR